MAARRVPILSAMMEVPVVSNRLDIQVALAILFAQYIIPHPKDSISTALSAGLRGRITGSPYEDTY